MDRFITIKSILEYIENRVAAELSAGEITAVAGFSAPHLREVFRDATGQTLARYITRRRLCHAASELARTKRPITEIAMDYGFASHDGFTRAFRRAFGENPAGFRANGRQIHGTLIVPGVFGPSVSKEDLLPMSSVDNARSWRRPGFAHTPAVSRPMTPGPPHSCGRASSPPAPPCPCSWNG